MFEDFINALNNFRTNKMRTILSLLGIVIGVTSVVIITTLGNSLQKSMEKEFEKYSLKVIMMISRWNEKTHKPAIKLDDEFRKKILQEIPEIKNIFLKYDAQVDVSRAKINAGRKNLEAADPHRLEDLEIELDYGHFFESADYVTGVNKAIIGYNIALILFPEGNAIGKKIDIKINAGGLIKVYPFEVIGVLKDKRMWFMQTQQSVFIPKSSFTKIYDVKRMNIYSSEIIAYDENKASIIKTKLEKIAQDLSPDVYRPVWINSAKSELDQSNKVLGMVRFVIVAIAGISLLVGGIGIMNIMLVTVTERRKEIGIRKALGATNRAIRLQFLVESATLTLTGGLAGVVFGMFVAKIIIDHLMPGDAPIQFFFDINGTIIAFSVSVFIGVFFGLHPAVQAARLDPVVALGD